MYVYNRYIIDQYLCTMYITKVMCLKAQVLPKHNIGCTCAD